MFAEDGSLLSFQGSMQLDVKEGWASNISHHFGCLSRQHRNAQERSRLRLKTHLFAGLGSPFPKIIILSLIWSPHLWPKMKSRRALFKCFE